MKQGLIGTAMALLLGLAAVAALAAGDEPGSGGDARPPAEEKLWEETGSMAKGTIEAHRGKSVPPEELGSIDASSLEQIEKRWEELREGEKEEIPPLRYRVPVDTKSARPTSPPTELGLPTKALNDFIQVKNTNPSSVAPVGFSSLVNEPTAVAVDDVVFYTGNWYSALSTDGGDSFAFVNPYNGPFAPLPDGGFCCDQVTAYSPKYDALFYLQQTVKSATNGTHRINVDLGADGTFDCMFDVTPNVLGMGPNTWADFPDLVVSENFLYHSSNVYSTAGNSFVGAFAVRYPLNLIGTCTGTTFDVYRDFGGFFSFRFTRGATTTMYFADHISNTSIRIWRWPDGDASPTSFDRTVTAWSDATRVCPGPDGRDWCGRLDRRLRGAFLADGLVGFMWVPSQDGSFPYPYTRIARFSEGALTLVDQPLIWSTEIAWVYPSAAVNAHGDLGGSILVGGGASLYTTCAVWIADDVNGDTIGPLENSVAYFGSTGPASNVSGDYTGAQPYYPNPYLWTGACFGYSATTVGHSRFVIFGREGNLPIFTDGFESGNLSAWSAHVP